MTKRVSKKPKLFTVPDGPGAPTLLGRRCTCGHTFFPPQDYGCEKCGSEQLSPVELAGRGVLQTFAVVYKHRYGGIKTPFAVGAVRLDDGPSVMAQLEFDDPDALEIGQAMVATLVETGTDSDGNSVVDCQFAPGATGQGDA